MNNEYENLSNKKKSIIIRNKFKLWKQSCLERCGYFTIFQGFEENKMLKDISGNALRLYIYLGLHANNYEGIVWHSNIRIAKYFGKSERTIRAWMKELEDMGLIKRMRLRYDGEVYTFLAPYESKNKQEFLYQEGVFYFSNEGYLCFQGEYNSFVVKDNISQVTIYLDDLGTLSGELKYIAPYSGNNRQNKKAEYTISDYEKKRGVILEYEKDIHKIFPAVIYKDEI
ncbi:MAG: helix-turn-helix domain-containing protein [Clostridium sp.]|uniref:helix-turn-helix domain-containing protein n=1 Tax=Clostridium sp. TaxID=1506 RepID=UPI0025B98CF4|nr:helix-turn-helix domain-containing protein [Clostridium sp.]MBS5927554.1 helix-turn-helix domain-containing protein [Clostridium sp.]